MSASGDIVPPRPRTRRAVHQHRHPARHLVQQRDLPRHHRRQRRHHRRHRRSTQRAPRSGRGPATPPPSPPVPPSTCRSTAASDLHGNWTSTGDGLVRLSGTLQPKSAPLTLGFAADRLLLGAVTLDGSVQPIRNTGVLPLDDETISVTPPPDSGSPTPPAPKSARAAPSPSPTAPPSSTKDSGPCPPAATSCRNDRAPAERFINTGTLRATSFTNEIYPGITVDNVGTIDVTGGQLNVHERGPAGLRCRPQRWDVAGRRLARAAGGAAVDHDRLRRVRRARRQWLRVAAHGADRRVRLAAALGRQGPHDRTAAQPRHHRRRPAEHAVRERDVHQQRDGSSRASPARRPPGSSATSSPPARSPSAARVRSSATRPTARRRRMSSRSCAAPT